jgi:hypothetical protein
VSYVNQLKCDRCNAVEDWDKASKWASVRAWRNRRCRRDRSCSSDASLDVHLYQFAPIASLNGSAKRPNGAPKLTLNETAWVDDLRLLTR